MMVPPDEIQAALKTWRDGLVGLTRQSALIKFRASKTSSLLIDSPTPNEILAQMQAGRTLKIRGELDDETSDSPKPYVTGGTFHSPRPDSEIGPVLRTLMRRASTVFLDRGLSVLYIAFGVLDWTDIDGTEMLSPLLLVPVRLIPEGPKSTPSIADNDEEPVLNPALVLRLKEFGIDLPSAEDVEGLTVTDTFALIRTQLERNKSFNGWELRETTYLSMFSFAKEAMFKDLLDNETQILDHPIVRALATSDSLKQTSEFQFDPIDVTNIDKLSPPELTPLVLDADSSQRVAVAAALAGSSFVMDGPPGTGKSQTIANMIGALLHGGKTVLFVSEKMAALDVVRNRLESRGLGSYLLELHSHKASRKEVATELLKTLDNVVIPPVEMPSMTRIATRSRREQLNDYAAAMNDNRLPLNMSLHHVLGLYSNLSDAPLAPVPEVSPGSFSEGKYFVIQDSLKKIVRSWRPAAQRESFLWRNVIDEQSLEVRLYEAQNAIEQLSGTAALNADLIDAFDLRKPSDTPKLMDLIEHQYSGHPGGVLQHWLTVETSRSLASARVDLGLQIDYQKSAEDKVIGVAGVPWTELSNLLTRTDDQPSEPFSPIFLDFQNVKGSKLAAVADQFEEEANILNTRLKSLNSLASSLGIPPVSTFADIDRLATIIDLRSKNTRPSRAWFSSSGVDEARVALGSLRDLVTALRDTETKAAAVFSPEALTAPLADLQDRFSNLHRGLKKLSGNYRSDKRIISDLLINASNVKLGINHLSDAVQWSEASKAMDGFAETRGEFFGSHWAGRETDLDAVKAAITVVEEIRGLIGTEVPSSLITYLSGNGLNREHQIAMDSIRADLDKWKSGLLPAPALTGRPELLLEAVDQVINWLSSQVEPIRRVVERIDAVRNVTNEDYSLVEVEELLILVREVHVVTESFKADESVFREKFGNHFKFAETDLDALDDALGWAEKLRTIANEQLTEEQLNALEQSVYVEKLRPTFDKWIKYRDRIVASFAPNRYNELTAELNDYLDAVTLMNDLRSDTVGQQEWFEYKKNYATLSEFGLNAAIDFCIEQRTAEHEVPMIVNRALLRGWSDAVIQGDERLRPLLATEREALIEEYRDLDRDLIKAATSDIIIAANSRRPQNPTIGQSGVIRREGGKQKRHRPVRDLMASTRIVTPSIKPVFMMSPMAVSQYLPPDMQFDVVIFDEASQVTPGDAINCIYRGKSLILAGDDKQLPPTSFFERNIDDDDEADTDVKDFQSILELSKAAGAFNNLGLRWHYRSRHEDLIAFSNYKFYDGKLVTFPSARVDGNDVGVEFFHAHGVYRRGGGAINPIEAAKTAERVMEHFTNRPDLTLGVVTFSVAQADAVQNAIDEARVARRDLDRFFDTEDRLSGFFIRALEQVQGDERDVIIFSVGYGPDEAGKISINFGALNRDRGWRRLNVGITRARYRIEVVASMIADQIPPSTNENVEYFRAYLNYAEKGSQTLAIPASPTGLDPESPFEESVLAAIQGWGYNVEPQVGAAGFRIDLGVRHPAFPGMFAIGIECDGYQYHSAPAARDRDRLRDQILSGLGWRLHRIWGTAWYRDRATEEIRLRAAIEDAISAPLNNRTKMHKTIERPVLETEQVDSFVIPAWTTPYRVAPEQRLPYWVDPGESQGHLHMEEAIQILVEHEGPIHIDVAYARLRAWWGIGQVGSKIRKNIDQAILETNIIRDGDFLLQEGAESVQIRTPTGEVVRKPSQVHVQELGIAVTMTIRDAGAANRAEVVNGVARILGWSRTGSLVAKNIDQAIDRLLLDGKVSDSEGTLTLVS